MDRLKSLILLGTALGVIESVFIPPFLPVRLGLANAATLAAVLLYGARAGLVTTIARSLSVGVITGGIISLPILFSLCGGIASALAMSVAALLPVSVITVSAVGGAASMIAQLLFFAVTGSLSMESVMSLFPLATGWGIASGVFVGTVVVSAAKPHIAIFRNATIQYPSTTISSSVPG